MSTCGHPECVLPAGHGGDLHVGPETESGSRALWPVKAARERAAARGIIGPVMGRLADHGARLTPAADTEADGV